MENLIRNNTELLNQLNQNAAEKSLNAVQLETLVKLHKNEIITSKLFIMLNHEHSEQKNTD
jgi:CPA1 family monovalent cation:H+ antiporter